MQGGNRAAAVLCACVGVLLLGIACGSSATPTGLPTPVSRSAPALPASPETTPSPRPATPVSPASPTLSPVATPRPTPTLPGSAALPGSIEAIATAAKLVQGSNGQPAHLLGASLLRLQDELAEEAFQGIRRLPPAEPDTPVWRVEFDQVHVDVACSPESYMYSCDGVAALVVLDAVSGEPLGVIQPLAPTELTPLPVRGFGWERRVVVAASDGAVRMLDPSSGREVFRVEAGANPSFVLSADQQTLYVAGGSQLTATDTTSGRQLWRAPLAQRRAASADAPPGLAVSPDQQQLYVASGQGASSWVQIFATSDGRRLSETAHFDGTACPAQLAASPDHATLYLICWGSDRIESIDLASGKLRPETITMPDAIAGAVRLNANPGLVEVVTRGGKRGWLDTAKGQFHAYPDLAGLQEDGLAVAPGMVEIDDSAMSIIVGLAPAGQPDAGVHELREFDRSSGKLTQRVPSYLPLTTAALSLEMGSGPTSLYAVAREQGNTLARFELGSYNAFPLLTITGTIRQAVALRPGAVLPTCDTTSPITMPANARVRSEAEAVKAAQWEVRGVGDAPPQVTRVQLSTECRLILQDAAQGNRGPIDVSPDTPVWVVEFDHAFLTGPDMPGPEQSSQGYHVTVWVNAVMGTPNRMSGVPMGTPAP